MRRDDGATVRPSVADSVDSRPRRGLPAAARAALTRRFGGDGRHAGRGRVVMLGALILLAGLGVSAFIANERHASVAQSNHRAFQITASDLTSALRARLDANTDLARAMRAVATMEPTASDSRYAQWYSQLEQGRAPTAEGTDAVLIVPVPASKLNAFERQQLSDPTFRRLVSGPFQVVPAGSHPVYCLSRAVVGPALLSSYYPPGFNYCAPEIPGIGRSPYLALIRGVTDTGSFIVTPVHAGIGSSMVALGVAVYRRGVPLHTVAQRRAAVIGYIATTFDSDALVAFVVARHGSITVALYHSNPGAKPELIGRAGAHPSGRSPGYLISSALPGGWAVEVTGTAPGAVSPGTQALIVLGLGALVTILVFLLYLVLALSRQRAWGLVGEKTQALEYRALHDPLTGLPNRALVLDRAEQVLERARRIDVPVTVLFMDIDGFKQINDRFGHKTGDDVLRQIGARLQSVLRGSDTVGRLGGDEFVMVLDCSGPDAAHPERVAERILALLARPLDVPQSGQAPVVVSASIGIATAQPPSAEDLLQEADIAMYQAKAAGKGGYVLFESSMQAAIADRLHLEMDLADALAADQLFLEYQPVLNLGTEEVVGVEALLRWQHPTRGVIAPDGFIPIAESSGLMAPIGRWVLAEACSHCAGWRAKGYLLNVSVNVSPRQFERAEFFGEVHSALVSSGLEAAALTLEITEATLVRRPAATARVLTDLRELGVSIAVDDFGTGYSSLGYLRQFPLDSIKIDRSFISGLASSADADALAHTLIQLGKTLGIKTLAEGVEQRSQLRQLRDEGCDLVQGFLFARSLSPTALEVYLEEHLAAKTPPQRAASR
jgi:diguanylate cyclase (GGDEF)-like protein